MTDDLKAPERIWATEDAKNFGEDRFHTTRPMKGLTEYVRADLSPFDFDTQGKANVQKCDRVKPGLYRVHWRDGGSSEVAIGMTSNGDNWMAPTNWLRPTMVHSLEGDTWGSFDRLEQISTDRIATLEAALADMTQQRDAAMAGAVKVKPLVWVKHPSVDIWRADTAFGTYKVFGLGPTQSWDFDSFSDLNDKTSKSAESVTAAKAAAQADYEARILAALTPDPDCLIALTAMAYEDAATITSRHKRYWEDAAADIRARIPADAIAALSRIEAQAEARGMLTERARWWQPEYPGQTEPVRVAWWRDQPEEGLSGFDTEHDRDAFRAGGPGPFIRRVTGNTFRQMPPADATEAAASEKDATHD